MKKVESRAWILALDFLLGDGPQLFFKKVMLGGFQNRSRKKSNKLDV